jgi:enoyl-CoA hydratase
MLIEFGGGDDIRFERIGEAGVITLARPKQLNAVTHEMVKAMARALPAWEADDAVKAVVIKAEGRAFSAGGDILHIYERGKAGDPPVEFFADEYRLNAAIRRFKKPYVALIDGIVMGGGVGVSFHGSHRILGDHALFAMPEVGIGFFPDVGGSYFLSRLKGSFGMYLGLTGVRIKAGDALWCGLATQVVRSADFPALLEAICETGDPDAAVKEYCTVPARETHEAAIMAIGHHFSRSTLHDTVESLRQTAGIDAFAERTLHEMAKRSPTSLHVAFRQIWSGRMLSMDECMRMEFRIVNRMLRGHDFYEGIRAAVIDKGDIPRWRPSSIDLVKDAAAEAYFAPLPGGELVL